MDQKQFYPSMGLPYFKIKKGTTAAVMLSLNKIFLNKA
jgi:hypothetical protein